MEKRGPRVVLIGLDGAVPEIIDRLIERGELPNIAKVYSNGVHGILKSTTPSVSAPAWASFMTGVHPGKHGIFGFEGRVDGSYKSRLMTSADMRARNIWEHLSDHGKRVAAVNVVMSYPPMRVNGVLVSGFLAPMEALIRNFTYPPELAEELLKDGYKVEPEVLIYQSKRKYVDEVFSVMEGHARVALSLLEKDDWDCLMVVFTSVDRLQHRFWQYMEPDGFNVKRKDVAEFGNVIEDCYKRCDELIGKFMERLDSETHLILMSDHGFSKAATNFNINNWLVEQGLLKIKAPRGKKLLLSRYRMIAKVLGRTGLMSLVNLLRSKYPGIFRKMTGQLKIHDAVVWQETKAFVVEKAIYINLKGRDPQGTVAPGAEFEALRNSITERLLALQDPATGQTFVERVMKGEEVYTGPYVHLGGDLLIRFKPGYRHWPRLEPGAPVITKEQIFCSYHHDQEDGFFAVQGPHVRSAQTETASITDIAPTVMHLLGVPLPSGLDGEPLLRAFEESSPIATRGIRVSAENPSKARVRDVVRALKAAGRI